MIISLEDAQLIDADVRQEQLDAFEVAIRRLTNNNFQNTNVRFHNVKFTKDNTIEVSGTIDGLRIGDTLEVNESQFNDGLYEVVLIDEQMIQLDTDKLYTGDMGMATKVDYPADIKAGIKKLIAYDLKMGDKVGVKSESVSRMSTTYYDMNSSENVDGYPSSLVSFLKKYEKMRW